MRASLSAVKQQALAHSLQVFQPASLKEDAAIERVTEARPDVLVVAAYGLLLPLRALQIAPLGALNIHASLLPRWRGAAPIQRALLAGDRETGITIMQMDEGLDTGPMLSRHALPIAAEDDAQTLHDKLAEMGARAIVTALADLAAGRARPVAQPQDGVTYAKKLDKAEGELDWSRPAQELERQVRAFRPAPGSRSALKGETFKVWRVRIADDHADRSGPAGVVLEADERGVLVACGQGALWLTELQRQGGKRLAAADFLRGFAVAPGERLGPAR